MNVKLKTSALDPRVFSDTASAVVSLSMASNVTLLITMLDILNEKSTPSADANPRLIMSILSASLSVLRMRSKYYSRFSRSFPVVSFKFRTMQCKPSLNVFQYSFRRRANPAGALSFHISYDSVCLNGYSIFM